MLIAKFEASPRMLLRTALWFILAIGKVVTSSELTGYCTNISTPAAPQDVKDIVQSSLWREFGPVSTRTSLNLSIGFDQSDMCQLEQHHLTTFQCSFSYSKLVYDDLGKPIHDQTNQIRISTIKEADFAAPQSIFLGNLPSSTNYIFWLSCSVRYQDGTTDVYQSQYREATTKSFMVEPTDLKAFVHHHRYDLVKKSRWVVLEWAPVPIWESGVNRQYQISCTELAEACLSSCVDNFQKCSSCIGRKRSWRWRPWEYQKNVPWFHTTALVPEEGEANPVGIHDSQHEVTMIVCSVRVDDSYMTWAKPALVNLLTHNPAPRLLILGQMAGQTMLANFDAATAFNETYISMPHITSYRRSPAFGSKLFEFGSGIDPMKPRISPWPLYRETQSIPADFCKNWIHQADYTIISCKDNSSFTCLYKDDDITKTTGESLLLHHAGIGTPIQQIACNPFKDIVAATQKKGGSELYDLLIYHETSGTANHLDLSCSSFVEKTGGIASAGIAIDWKNDGAVLVVGVNKEIWSLNLEYGKECTGKKVGSLPPSQDASQIKKLAVDWHNFYWMTDQHQVQLASQNGESVVAQLNEFVHIAPLSCGRYRPCTGLDKAEFQRINNIKAAAPEMRKFADPEIYCPDVESLELWMIANNTASVKTTLKWNSDLVSMQTSLTVDIYYKLYEEGDEETGCDFTISPSNCQSVVSSEKSRNITHHQTIPNLDKGKLYYVEPHPYIENSCGYKTACGTIKNGTIKATFKPEPTEQPSCKNYLWIVAVALGIAGLLLLGILAQTIWYYVKVKPLQHLPRIGKNQIKKIRLLGKGHFTVWEAILTEKGGKECQVAVKILLESADIEARKNLLEEAIILGHMKHRHVVKIKGICLDSNSSMIVLEFINGGSLNTRLKQCILSRPEQLQTAIDVCKACIYLKEQGYIHRDVRSANVLIETNGKQNKFRRAVLTDFGLAKDQGAEMQPFRTNQPEFPIRYSAPECFHGEFTSANDVYMFGILLWEIFSNGQVPNADIPISGHGPTYGLIQRILYEDLHPQQPAGCPDELYRMMTDCWVRIPKHRPPFSKLLVDLEIIKRQLTFADPYYSSVDQSSQEPHLMQLSQFLAKNPDISETLPPDMVSTRWTLDFPCMVEQAKVCKLFSSLESEGFHRFRMKSGWNTTDLVQVNALEAAFTICEGIFHEKPHPVLARTKLYQQKWKPKGTFKEFLCDLRRIAKDCQLRDQEDLRIMEAILTNCNDKELLEKIFDAYPGVLVNLQNVLDIAQSHEHNATKKDSKLVKMEQSCSRVFAIRDDDYDDDGDDDDYYYIGHIIPVRHASMRP